MPIGKDRDVQGTMQQACHEVGPRVGEQKKLVLPGKCSYTVDPATALLEKTRLLLLLLFLHLSYTFKSITHAQPNVCTFVFGHRKAEQP